MNGTGSGTIGTVFISDLAGKRVLQTVLPGAAGMLDIAALPSGIYFVKYTDAVRTGQATLVKQ